MRLLTRFTSGGSVAITNLREFTISIRRGTEEAHEAHRRRTRAAMLYALQNLVLGSRVDTGRFRGNWQVTEGSPAEGYEQELYDFAGRFGNRDALVEETENVLQASGDEIIWAHNGVPYAEIIDAMDHVVLGAAEATRTWLDSSVSQDAP
jgi:hypothetical protein